MKKSKLLILISFLALGCNTGSLSSDNPSESLSNTLSSEEILSNEEDLSINSSTYSFDYTDLKSFCSESNYVYFNKNSNEDSTLLDKAHIYWDYCFYNKLDCEYPGFIISGDRLIVSYYGDIYIEVSNDSFVNSNDCYIVGEIIDVEYVRNEISMASYEELVDDGLMCVISDTDYTILDIREANQDMTYYVTRGTDGQVLTAYTFNPLEI